MRTHLAGFAFAALALVASATAGFGQTTDLLGSAEVRELVAGARTPADHAKLGRHYAALAGRYEADAAAHRELAALYRKSPTASETKRPGMPDTAAHCERFARQAASTAAEARRLAASHERMAAGR